MGTLKLNAQTLQLGKLEVQDYNTHSSTETHEITQIDHIYLLCDPSIIWKWTVCQGCRNALRKQ